jgi:hypothetical protein
VQMRRVVLAIDRNLVWAFDSTSHERCAIRRRAPGVVRGLEHGILVCFTRVYDLELQT